MRSLELILSFCLIFYNTSLFAHGGRTDTRGGHYDRINGGYHYHHGEYAHQHPNGICPFDSNNLEIENSKNTSSKNQIQKFMEDYYFLVYILMFVVIFVFLYVLNKFFF
jgi:hypothetical protein